VLFSFRFRKLRPPGKNRFSVDHARENYNRHVARGWESKSVEAQQAEAAESSKKSRPRLNASEAAVVREKENLRLARQTILRQMETSTNPRHQEVLQSALADLDRKLQRLK
jgi:hypothetical protein